MTENDKSPVAPEDLKVSRDVNGDVLITWAIAKPASVHLHINVANPATFRRYLTQPQIVGQARKMLKEGRDS